MPTYQALPEVEDRSLMCPPVTSAGCKGGTMSNRRRIQKAFTVHLISLLFLGATSSVARSEDFIQENTFFRVSIGSRAYRLEGLVVKRSDTTGRLPVALLAHGEASNLQNMLDEHATDLLGQARDWLIAAGLPRS
jgi:hypothetical protein